MGLTSSQLEAVAARGNVIVVAGAGTGKTSTLVERCVALLAEGCSIENILMVTFTDAAAAEMRHRLRLRLAEVAGQSAEDAARVSWWQEQLALLDTARICTLHSFCLQLIRENFHLLGIDPVVKILDVQQVRPLIEGALDACLEPHFGGADAASESVRELIRRYGQGDPERIRGLVLGLHRHGQSLADPEQWFSGQLALLDAEEPQPWRDWLLTGARQWAALWRPELEQASGTAVNLERCARALRALEQAGSGDAVAEAVSKIRAADEAEWPKKQKTRLREPFKKLFEEAEFLSSQFETVGEGDGLAADWANVRLSLRALLQLTQEFSASFARAKREAGGIDFADLEQFSLRLLWDCDGKLTPVAQQCRAGLAQVFVDECQDINAAQDAILRAVSWGDVGNIQNSSEEGQSTPDPSKEGNRTAGNRFLVGDVKQSIYQFRLARPALFLGYEREWKTGESGRWILLSDNFRSAPEIIGFVNALFAPLMREELGGVEYLPLVEGRPAVCSAPLAANVRAVEFHLIPKTLPGGASEAEAETTDDAGRTTVVEDMMAVEREARLVALRLRALHQSGLEIWDKEFAQLRRVEWRDMAVLLRSPAHRVEAFAQEFHKCGVPLQAARGGFLQTTEITDLLSLLRLLDNPLQDIPLLAVLRSPLVALTLDELAEVRIASREKRFWTALQQFHQRRTDKDSLSTVRSAWGKVDQFLTQFRTWRELVRQASLSQCLERSLTDTDYVAIVEAGERGAERMANVRRFVRMVREYDPYQRQGLFRFLRYIDALIDAEQDLEPAPAQSQNAVRLMSIHQSKGLEFPVVVLACLGGLFNLGDLHRDVLLDEEFGVCAKAVAPLTNGRHPTVSHWLAAQRQKRQCLGEELRLLYVAATRARDRLLLTATATRRDSEYWEAVGPRSFGSREMLAARSPLDWLLLWLPTVTATGDWAGDGGANSLLHWRIWNEAGAWELGTPQAEMAGVTEFEDSDGNSAAGVIQRIDWKYPQDRAAHEPAKTNVTALRRKAAEFMDDEAVPWPAGARLDRNRDRAARGLSAAEVGTLHHRFLQRMRIDGVCDEAGLRHQLAEMVEQGMFTVAESEAVNVTMAAQFWQGEVGREIRRQVANVRREVPFTVRFSPLELEQITGAPMAPELAEEFVVVQGVADLLVIGERELWLLDFKTDDVTAVDVASKVALYQPQLRLYATALAAIYAKPVTRCWLHFLKLGETRLVS